MTEEIKTVVEKLRRLNVNQLRDVRSLVNKLTEGQTEKEAKDEPKRIV